LKLDDCDYRPAFVLDDVQQVVLENLDFPEDKNEQIILKDTRDASFDSKSERLVKMIK